MVFLAQISIASTLCALSPNGFRALFGARHVPLGNECQRMRGIDFRRTVYVHITSEMINQILSTSVEWQATSIKVDFKF